MKTMNLPNRLTVLRMVIVPILWACDLLIPSDWCVLDPASGLNGRSLIVVLLFALASLTDFLDGRIARRHNLITSFGKFLDPIADKMLVNTTLILLVYHHQAAVLPVLLMIARDLVVDGLRFSAASQGKVVSAGMSGKLKTVLQMIAIPLLLLGNWPFSLIPFPAASLALWLAAAASLYSGWIYFDQLKSYVLETM